MKILIFTEGTIIMHKNAAGHSREEIVKQVETREQSVKDYKSYVPIGDAVKKLKRWKSDGAEILYLTSRIKTREIEDVRNVIKSRDFPSGKLLFRKPFRSKHSEYAAIVGSAKPEIFIEDDCESIGGVEDMTITYVKPEIKKKIKSIVIKEFGGIGHLPDKISDLMK